KRVDFVPLRVQLLNERRQLLLALLIHVIDALGQGLGQADLFLDVRVIPPGPFAGRIALLLGATPTLGGRTGRCGLVCAAALRAARCLVGRSGREAAGTLEE